MPGFLLHMGAVVQCAHQGTALPTAPVARVRIGGQPVATQASPYMVAGCTLLPPAGGPCISAEWLTGALRVRALGQPVLLTDGQAICTPTGTPLLIQSSQTRVRGT